MRRAVALTVLIVLAMALLLNVALRWEPCTFLSSRKEFVYLYPVIPNSEDMGGFAWHLHHVQCLLHLCEVVRLRPVVVFDSGYYFDSGVGPNWWNYFFEAFPGPSVRREDLTPIRSLPLSGEGPYLYTNATFQKLLRPMRIDFAAQYKKIRLNSHMRRRVEEFEREHFGERRMVGVHFRGTDKFPSEYGNEDMRDGKHLTYEDVLRKLSLHVDDKTKVFCTTDEQPFADACRRAFPSCVTHDSYRASVSTSGLKVDKQDKQTLSFLASQSVHRGAYASPYKKGYDAVMDIWLLSKCELFLRSNAGNFGSQPARINPSLVVKELF